MKPEELLCVLAAYIDLVLKVDLGCVKPVASILV